VNLSTSRLAGIAISGLLKSWLNLRLKRRVEKLVQVDVAEVGIVLSLPQRVLNLWSVVRQSMKKSVSVNNNID